MSNKFSSHLLKTWKSLFPFTLYLSKFSQFLTTNSHSSSVQTVLPKKKYISVCWMKYSFSPKCFSLSGSGTRPAAVASMLMHLQWNSAILCDWNWASAFPVSVWVSARWFSFLPQSKSTHSMLIGYSKLVPWGVTESVFLSFTFFNIL